MNQPTTNTPALTGFALTKSMFSKDATVKRFEQILGKKTQGFMASVLQVVSSNGYLKDADPTSVYTSALMAATLDLPINNNLGFAYIVPYNDKNKGQIAQFQMGYKGFVQLAMRSGQYKTISATKVCEGQLVSNDPLMGVTFDWNAKKSDKVVGYCAYIKMINGFEKHLYMTYEEVLAHSKRYSKSAAKSGGVWKDNFDAMAEKTVLKLLLSKYGTLSIEMQTAMQADQAVIRETTADDGTVETTFEYCDNEDDTPAVGNSSKPDVADTVELISDNQLADLRAFLEMNSIPEGTACSFAGVALLDTLPADRVESIFAAISEGKLK